VLRLIYACISIILWIKIGAGNFFLCFTGLALDEAGNLLTLEEGSCGTINILTVCPIKKAVTARVKVELQISYPDIPFSKPRFLAWHSCNTLLVVDLGIDRIFQVDYKMGYCIKSFGTPGKASGQFNDPAGITSDNLGYIYIADSRNHRIQVYDPFLDFACILEKDAPLFRPSGIHVTPNDDLLVINYWENSIAKFNLITKKPMGY
ncbi:E3 ubiquitin-protein ligase TRIM71-like 3, partial [Homarus americanus]